MFAMMAGGLGAVRFWRYGALVFFGAVGIASGGVLLWHLAAPNLQQQGDRLIVAIEEFKTVHGRYPDSFDEAGIVPPATRFGPWMYKTDMRGQNFYLSIGDYGTDLFALGYSSTWGQWSVDR